MPCSMVRALIQTSSSQVAMLALLTLTGAACIVFCHTEVTQPACILFRVMIVAKLFIPVAMLQHMTVAAVSD